MKIGILAALVGLSIPSCGVQTHVLLQSRVELDPKAPTAGVRESPSVDETAVLNEIVAHVAEHHGFEVSIPPRNKHLQARYVLQLRPFPALLDVITMRQGLRVEFSYPVAAPFPPWHRVEEPADYQAIRDEIIRSLEEAFPGRVLVKKER